MTELREYIVPAAHIEIFACDIITSSGEGSDSGIDTGVEDPDTGIL